MPIALLGFVLSGASNGVTAIGGPFESLAAMIDRRPENKITLGFIEGLDDKIRVFERRVYSLRDEDCLRRKILTCSLPEL